MPRLLIVEDEYAMRRALEDTLTAAGYRIITASDGQSGLDRALAEKPDLILLDIMMPRLDGLTVAAQLRRSGCHTPLLILTAKGSVPDRVQGLDAGADDYLVKPFSTDELLARVRALLRRRQREGRVILRLRLGDVAIDFARQVVTKNGQEIHLTTREFSMLRLLAEADGQPVASKVNDTGDDPKRWGR
jgi:two-component system response regulator MprA